MIGLGGKNINIAITKPLAKYIMLKIIFLLYFFFFYPDVSVPNILNKPIIDKIVTVHHSGKPLSLI